MSDTKTEKKAGAAKAPATMAVEITDRVEHDNEVLLPGAAAELPATVAARLIELGVAKKA